MKRATINHMRIVLSALICTGSLLLAPGARSAGTTLTTTVERVLVAGDDRFGGCMALLADSPGRQLPGCPASWVTFSCSGDFTDPVRAYRMLDQAQLALATDKPVLVQVTDSQKHDGFCFASRIDVIR